MDTMHLWKSRLFGPGMRLMNRLTYPQKFVLLTLVLVAPLALVMYFLISEINTRVEFSQKELYGTAYLRPLNSVLRSLGDSHLPAGADAVGHRFQLPDGGRTRAVLTAGLERLEATDHRLGNLLETGETLTVLRERWKSLQQRLPALAITGGDLPDAEMMNALQALIAHVGDTSNLILDPDLDSYYLMDATLLKLPDVEDLLVQAGRLSLRLQQQGPDAAEKAELNQLLGRFQANLDALHKGMNVAFQHTQSPTLRPLLERALREYTSALQAVLAWLHHQAAPSGGTQAAEAHSVFRRAWEAAFTLWDESIGELDRLLKARIEGFERRRNLMVAWSLAALLGVVYLWVGFYASVVGAVASLEGASQQMLRGDFPASVSLPTRDELGQVATSFNNVARRLREEWAQAQEESRNASRAEASLRASEARTRLIIDTALDAVIGMDADGCVIEWNAQAESTFGWTSQEALGRNLADLIIPAHLRGAHARGLEHFLATGEGPVLRQRLEVAALHRAGHAFPVELTISPLRTGAICTFSAFARDISARKQAERELQNAKEAAEAASRAKSEFLATMSHEIRTPMNGVLGMIGLLLDTPLQPEQREFAQTVQNSAEALLTIINDILDFSKIEAGRITIEPIPFDLEVAAEEVIELLAARAHEKNLELALRYAPHTPRCVVGDPGRIRQILLNLAGNAIKFTACGHVLVDIQELPTVPGPACSDSHNAPSSVAHITIAVHDTGIGIAEDKIPGLFHKFTQADASTTRQFGGTGLGLAISKQLVELMGGTIEVTSAQGTGSTFSCMLPLPLDTALPAPRALPADLTGVRVLVVDDHAVQRRLYCEQLSAWGMRCCAAESAARALEMLRRAQTEDAPFQIALLDSRLPAMAGEALGQAIKADPQLQAIALVLLTSAGQRGDAERLQQAGFAASLGKPVRASHLREALVRARDTHVQGVQPRSLPHHTPPGELQIAPSEASKQFRCRVLLAEDNRVNQKVAALLLEKLGCRVDIAGNGRETVEMLQKLPYDLIFMDCQMPELDGYEATAIIRKLPAPKRHVPVIAMTANTMQGDREKCLQAGMDDYVSKPIKKEDLTEMLERWVSVTASR